MNPQASNAALEDRFADRRVLVTGGGGFLGSHLVRHLVKLHSQVTSLGSNRDRAEVIETCRYIFGDIAQETLETIDFVPEIIFHLAGGASVASSIIDPPADFLKTVHSTVLLLDFLRRHWPEAKLVYVSSAAIYGEAKHNTANHDLACLPISPYGVHKRIVELLLLDHARMYRTNSVIVRPFSVYGPGLRKQLLWEALRKADRGVFEFFGTGEELRDWVFVGDLVNCLLSVSSYADASVPVFNAGTCHGVSVREILGQLFQTAGIRREPLFRGKPKEGDPDCLVAGDSAEAALGPLFRTPLREGIRSYTDWYGCSEAQ